MPEVRHPSWHEKDNLSNELVVFLSHVISNDPSRHMRIEKLSEDSGHVVNVTWTEGQCQTVFLVLFTVTSKMIKLSFGDDPFVTEYGKGKEEFGLLKGTLVDFIRDFSPIKEKPLKKRLF